MKQLDRLEAKLDAIDSKLDDHLERIAKTETGINWLKWTVSIIFTVIGSLAIKVFKI